MKKFSILILFFITIIWGSAFTFQSKASEYINAYTFNCLRFSIAALVMLPLSIFEIRHLKKKNENIDIKSTIIISLIAGSLLVFASILQQLGIKTTSVGKSGFITSLYIVIIPILSLFIKKYYGINSYIASVVALIGLYFLCVNGSFNIEAGDLYLIGCAIVYSFQIMFLDYASKKISPLTLSFGQCLVSAIISLPFMLIIDKPSINNISSAIWPTLYVAIFSTCIAYTLQIVGQKHVNPTLASLIMSLEAVFSAIFGVILLHQTMSVREIIGSIIMFIAIIFAQLPSNLFKIKRKDESN